MFVVAIHSTPMFKSRLLAVTWPLARLARFDRIPDLVLMDLSMPEVDGLMGIAALRSISRFRQISIIAMTAYPQELTLHNAINAGCIGSDGEWFIDRISWRV
jgi:CheY-like chemotaxis protein